MLIHSSLEAHSFVGHTDEMGNITCWVGDLSSRKNSMRKLRQTCFIRVTVTRHSQYIQSNQRAAARAGNSLLDTAGQWARYIVTRTGWGSGFCVSQPPYFITGELGYIRLSWQGMGA